MEDNYTLDHPNLHQVDNKEIINLAEKNFNEFSKKEKDSIFEDEFYECIDNYFKSNKMPSDVNLFKNDDFFHTFISKDKNRLKFSEFSRLFEDFLMYVNMKASEKSKDNNMDFNFDLQFDEDDFKGLI